MSKSSEFDRDTPRPRVLIVEDEALVAWDIGRTLAQHGFDICGTACSAQQAVSMATQLEPDLVLMDIHLAGNSDGIEAAKAISAVLQSNIVFVSAHWDRDTVERAAAARPRGFVQKPFTTQHLLDTLAQVIQERACHGRV